MKLYKFTCGVDEKVGVFTDEAEAYERRTEVDPTFYFLPVTIEEIAVPGYELVTVGSNGGQLKSDLVSSLRDLVNVQGREGNWNYDPYMHGMYNGMELMFSMVEGREPIFRDAPEEWISDRKVEDEDPPKVESEFPRVELDKEDNLLSDGFTVADLAAKPPDGDEFDAMDRKQLVEWLKANNVEYVPQWGDARLRETAKSHAQKSD